MRNEPIIISATVLALAALAFRIQVSSGQESKITSHPSTKPIRSYPDHPKPNPVLLSQPRLVTLPMRKCDDCTTALRKRIAVMLVKVETLSQELNLTSASVSEELRGGLEQAISKRSGIMALNRTDVEPSLDGQSLEQKGVTGGGISPLSGRSVPAQFLLSVTIDAVDIAMASKPETTDDSAEYERQASEKEQGAAADDQTAEGNSVALQNVESGLQALYDQKNLIDAQCSSVPGGYQGVMLAVQCIAAARSTNAEINNKEAERSNLQLAIEFSQAAAQQKRAEAQELHDKAHLESQKQQTETRTTTVTMNLTWRIVETLFGVEVASGKTSESDSSKQEGVLVQTTSTSEKPSSISYDTLVDGVISQTVDKLAMEVEDNVMNEPSRVKVVKVDQKGVVLNCGSALGAAEGDTFALLEKTEILTDPDTGLPLEKLRPPVGLIRVSEVSENTSFAQVVKAAGPLKRGDELIWVGMYDVAPSK